jgi:hypothetical protein
MFNNTKRLRRKNNSTKSQKTDHILQLLLDQIKLQSAGAPPIKRDVELIELPRKQIFTFRRSYDAGTIATGVVPTFGAFSFSLSSLPDFADFTALFDAYRLRQIRVTFYPVNNNVLPSACRLYTVIDYDDANPLVTIGAMQEYDTCQVMGIDNDVILQRTLIPKAALAIYSGAFTSFAQTSPGMWIDSGSPNVQYYGLKWALETSNAVTNVYRVEIDCIVECKHTR